MVIMMHYGIPYETRPAPNMTPHLIKNILLWNPDILANLPQRVRGGHARGVVFGRTRTREVLFWSPTSTLCILRAVDRYARGWSKGRACFGNTYTKIGTIQRRLAWPLRKDDTQIREAFQIFGHIYVVFVSYKL